MHLPLRLQWRQNSSDNRCKIIYFISRYFSPQKLIFPLSALPKCPQKLYPIQLSVWLLPDLPASYIIIKTFHHSILLNFCLIPRFLLMAFIIYSPFFLDYSAFMEPDDLLASEKLERLQRRQRRSRRSAPSSPDFEDLNDEDEGALDGEPQVAESRTRSRRQAPYIIYPEVLVIVDYDGYRLHGGDNLQVRVRDRAAKKNK